MILDRREITLVGVLYPDKRVEALRWMLDITEKMRARFEAVLST